MTIIQRIQGLWARPNTRPHHAPEGEVDWRETVRSRVGVAVVLFGIWAVGIEAKLIHLQVFERAELEAQARSQQQRVIVDPPKRGEILDRSGHVLATSSDVDSVYAVPTEIKNPADAAARLCAALGDCSRADRTALARKLGGSKDFVWVKRHATPEQAARVRALQLKYVGLQPESHRYYPNGELAAHVVGRVGLDNTGLAGVEHAYDKQISGRAGKFVVAIDGKQQVISRVEEPSTPGAQLELTIDLALQHVAERELRAAVQENRALGGTAIVLNPRTGELLAIANEPTFNPNEPIDNPQDAKLRNRAVQDFYEPGSTFKIITASAAVDEQVVPLDLVLDTSPGQIRIGGRTFSDTSNHGVLSFFDVIADSSNVGAIKVGQRVGIQRLSRYIDRFGFGKTTSTDFKSESPGRTWPASSWTELTLASVSIGYQVGVTPLQMVAAVSAIANGGSYIEPRIVRALYRDGRRNAVVPNVVRQVVSPDTAATLTTIMEGVVDHGTAKSAKIDGFTVAGKTGTAQKVVDGHYSSYYNASFVGFVPSRDPKLAIIVVIDSPRAKGYYGGVVSAPVFQRIAHAGLQRLGVAPTVNPAPPVLVSNQGSIPVGLTNQPGTPAVRLVAGASPNTVPDLRGLSLREAMRELGKLGIRVTSTGDGVVVSQSLDPGIPIEAGATCRLALDRRAVEAGQ